MLIIVFKHYVLQLRTIKKTTSAPALNILKPNHNCLRIWNHFDVHSWSSEEDKRHYQSFRQMASVSREWLIVRLIIAEVEGKKYNNKTSMPAAHGRPCWWTLSAWLELQHHVRGILMRCHVCSHWGVSSGISRKQEAASVGPGYCLAGTHWNETELNVQWACERW